MTAASDAQALAIARALVGDRLAACVNIVGQIRSIYRWRDKVEDDREVLLMIKTRTARLSAIARRVKALHTYEVPEMIAIPVAGGSARYLNWIIESAGPARKRRR